MGAGILPFTIHKGKVLFLFGRENKDKHTGDIAKKGMWSDFGGRREEDETYKQTAIREGFEETSGFLGDENNITKLVNEKCVKEIEHHKYKTFVIYVPYNDTIVKDFRKNFLFVKKNKPELYNQSGLYEKDMIKWVSYDKLYNFKHEARVFYRGIISKLIRAF